MAVALHYDLDDMEFFIEHQTASEDVDLGWLMMKKDTIAAIRAGWNGKVNGKTVSSVQRRLVPDQEAQRGLGV